MSAPNVESLFLCSSHNPSFHAVKTGLKTGRDLLDFCVPVNLHFPPHRLQSMIIENLPEILRYYPDYLDVHQKMIAEFTGLDPATIVPANGSTEVITMLCEERQGPMMTSVPTFGRWTDLPQQYGVPLHTIQRQRSHNFQLKAEEVVRRVREVEARTLVISNPNNPTGASFPLSSVVQLSSELKDLHAIILDESFIDFSDVESASKYAARTKNLIVVKSMGKAIGWHGLRLGYAVAEPRRARQLRSRLPFWNINGLAAFVLKKLPLFREEYKSSFPKTCADRVYMSHALSSIPGLLVYPSAANFIFIELPAAVSGKTLRNRLLSEYGVLVRETSNKLGSTERYLRLAVQRPAAVNVLVDALRTELRAIEDGCMGRVATERS